ncbi:MAG: hypothetical protein ACKVOX_11915 [Rhizobacter sp.]
MAIGVPATHGFWLDHGMPPLQPPDFEPWLLTRAIWLVEREAPASVQ